MRAQANHEKGKNSIMKLILIFQCIKLRIRVRSLFKNAIDVNYSFIGTWNMQYKLPIQCLFPAYSIHESYCCCCCKAIHVDWNSVTECQRTKVKAIHWFANVISTWRFAGLVLVVCGCILPWPMKNGYGITKKNH